MSNWITGLFKREEPINASWMLVDRNKVMPEPTTEGHLKIYVSPYDVPDAFRTYVIDSEDDVCVTAVIEFRYIELGEKKIRKQIDKKHEVDMGVHTKRAYSIFVHFDRHQTEHHVEFELVPDDIGKAMNELSLQEEVDKSQYQAAVNAVKTYADSMKFATSL